MGISHALNNALSGLTASSQRAEVISSNLANIMTDGYARRELELSSKQVGDRGGGVEIGDVLRIVDRGVLADRRLADANLAGKETGTRYLARVEGLLGTEGDPNNLVARLSRFEQSLIQASADPASLLRLENSMHELSGLVDTLNVASDGIQELRLDADREIAGHVSDLNRSLLHVEQLNADISKSLAMGYDASALIDKRQTTIDNISTIVPVRELDRGNGTVALMTPTGEMLIDGPAKQFGFEPVNIVSAESSIAAGGLSGITLDGNPVDISDGIGKLAGGSLGAAFEARDKTLVEAQRGLDQFARDLIERFQDPAFDPTLAPGMPGLLTDGSAVFDPLNETGLASRLRINALADPDQGGQVTALRDGIGATATREVGDSTQINLWLSALSERRAASGAPDDTAVGHAARLISTTAQARIQGEDELAFAQARQDTLRHAELSNGVDSDQELQTLLLVEQSYAANAKVIETIDALMRRLMEI